MTILHMNKNNNNNKKKQKKKQTKKHNNNNKKEMNYRNLVLPHSIETYINKQNYKHKSDRMPWG